MVKYLLTILCSSKIDLLKLCFESANNQLNFTDYDIFIVVNTLNELFYNEVMEYFKNHKYDKLKKIIRTESNGKPGKGHNSLLEIFKREIKYDYLLILDGDDFYYPLAIERINLLREKTNFDVFFLAGNTKLKKKNNLTHINNSYDVNINYYFYEVKNVANMSSGYNDIIATPYRLISLNREIFKIYEKLFDEDMQLYDDYYTFLLIYNLYKKNNFNELDNIKIYTVNDPYIYLYNTFNDVSVSKNSQVEHDIKIANKIKEKLNIVKLECEKLKIIPHYYFINDNFDKKIIDNFYTYIIKNTIQYDVNINNNTTNKKIIFIDMTDWSYDTFQSKPMGGTQSAIYYMAEYLSKFYNVTVMTKNEKNITINDKLSYKKIDLEEIKKINPDLFIIQGVLNTDLADYKLNNKNLKTIMWMHHDININLVKNTFETIHNLNLIDSYLFVSKWQRNRFIQKYKLSYDKCNVIQNGVQDNLNVFTNPVNINLKKKEIVYISSPYRGLIIAFYLFQEIKKYIPDIKLKVFSCFNRDFNNKFNKDNYKPYTKENFDSLLINDHNIYYKDFFKQLVDDNNIEFYGSVPQNILFEHLKTAMLMFYPNTYPETCCTSLLECMAHKCNVITSDLGALAETSNGFANIFNPLIENVLDEEYHINTAVRNPIQYYQVNDNYKKKFIEYTINIVNNYHKNYNIQHLEEQYNYIKNNCKWSDRGIVMREIIEKLI
jgi:hypothetical protein